MKILQNQQEAVINSVKLFCLPYGGGSAEYYRKWKRHLAPHIELHPIELKGRGRRVKEPFYQSFDEAVEDVYQEIKLQLGESRYALFGHSMGAMLIYELGHKMRESGIPAPEHYFFSGRGAPNTRNEEDDKVLHLMPDNELVLEMRQMGGTSDEVLNHEELLRFFLPLFRADFKIIETYVYKERPAKLTSHFSVFNGKEDKVNFGQLIEWKNHSEKECKIYNFPGGHFFINDYFSEIIKVINQVLT